MPPSSPGDTGGAVAHNILSRAKIDSMGELVRPQRDVDCCVSSRVRSQSTWRTGGEKRAGKFTIYVEDLGGKEVG